MNGHNDDSQCQPPWINASDGRGMEIEVGHSSSTLVSMAGNDDCRKDRFKSLHDGNTGNVTSVPMGVPLDSGVPESHPMLNLGAVLISSNMRVTG